MWHLKFNVTKVWHLKLRAVRLWCLAVRHFVYDAWVRGTSIYDAWVRAISFMMLWTADLFLWCFRTGAFTARFHLWCLANFFLVYDAFMMLYHSQSAFMMLMMNILRFMMLGSSQASYTPVRINLFMMLPNSKHHKRSGQLLSIINRNSNSKAS